MKLYRLLAFAILVPISLPACKPRTFNETGVRSKTAPSVLNQLGMLSMAFAQGSSDTEKKIFVWSNQGSLGASRRPSAKRMMVSDAQVVKLSETNALVSFSGVAVDSPNVQASNQLQSHFFTFSRVVDFSKNNRMNQMFYAYSALGDPLTLNFDLGTSSLSNDEIAIEINLERQQG